MRLENGGQQMPDQQPTASINRELGTKIVAAYVRHNQIAFSEVGSLISAVHEALKRLGKPAGEPTSAQTPAVPIRRSVTRDHVICLECGWKGQILRRHIMTAHGLATVDAYRARWNLKPDHPVTAPGYSERRSTMAKQFGLGQRRSGAAKAAAPPQPAPIRRGRPRSPATSTEST